MNPTKALLIGIAVFSLASCGGEDTRESTKQATTATGEVMTVQPAMVPSTIEASGTARPFAEATLATKLLGTVTAVLVREGDFVSAGQALVRIDARDLAAKNAQITAGVAEAEAVRREAETHVKRMRALYSEDAASRAQLDAAETAYARAEAGVNSARAATSELSALRDYSVVRAPFSGVITKRFVDPGAFAAPGAPLLTIQDFRRLRIVASAAPDAVRGISRGSTLQAVIEGLPATARVEGVVPTAASLYTVNAIVDNTQNQFLSGSAATLTLRLGERSALLVPERAVVRRGDLTGVTVSKEKSTELRWVRLGRKIGDEIEVIAGLRAGEQIVIPSALAEAN